MSSGRPSLWPSSMAFSRRSHRMHGSETANRIVSVMPLLTGMIPELSRAVTSPTGFGTAGGACNAAARFPKDRWGVQRPSVSEGVGTSPTPASWNQIVPWLRQIDGLRRAA